MVPLRFKALAALAAAAVAVHANEFELITTKVTLLVPKVRPTHNLIVQGRLIFRRITSAGELQDSDKV